MTELVIDKKQGSTFGMVPESMSEALKLAEIISGSNFAPKDYKGKPHDVLIAMQMGAEVGLKPMQSIQNIAVINGRPSLWGDALLAVVKAHKDFMSIQETDDGNTATCTIKRKGEPEHTTTFSMEDAKKANLAGKAGPWTQSPKRMRQLRARGFCCRDTFPDALKGLDSAEIVSDYEKDITPKSKSDKLTALIDVIDAPEPQEQKNIAPQDVLEKLSKCEDKNSLTDLVGLMAALPEKEKQEAREIYKEKMTGFAKQEAGELTK